MNTKGWKFTFILFLYFFAPPPINFLYYPENIYFFKITPLFFSILFVNLLLIWTHTPYFL